MYARMRRSAPYATVWSGLIDSSPTCRANSVKTSSMQAVCISGFPALARVTVLSAETCSNIVFLIN